MVAIVGVLLLLAGIIYPAESEKSAHHGHGEEHGHGHAELSLKDKLKLMWKVLSLWRVKKTVSYVALVTLTYCNFEVYIGYSNEEQYEITATFEGTMLTVTFIFTTMWLAFYNSIFTNTLTKKFTLAALAARLGNTFLMAALVKTG